MGLAKHSPGVNRNPSGDDRTALHAEGVCADILVPGGRNWGRSLEGESGSRN